MVVGINYGNNNHIKKKWHGITYSTQELDVSRIFTHIFFNYIFMFYLHVVFITLAVLAK